MPLNYFKVTLILEYIEPHQRDETNALAEQLPKITTNFTKHGSPSFSIFRCRPHNRRIADNSTYR